MELIRPFGRIGKADAGIAGGKGASLGEMTQAGIQIPPGFVLLSAAFERFLEEAGLNQELDTVFHTVNHQVMQTVEHASEKIRGLIMSARMPEDIADAIRAEFGALNAEYVAVRSSATAEDGANAAWAGQLDTYLNTTSTSLIENVQKCWASLFTPRAIFYQFEKGMHGSHISVAVVVQKMVQSEVSGVAFSVHPVTEDYNQIIIEAGFGLGEAIVSGQVTPDSFVVEKDPRRIIDKNVTFQGRALWRAKEGGNEWRELSDEEGNKPALLDAQVMELAELILRIERHYGFPCDIEWAFEAGQFFITQSRPITTLNRTASASTPNPADYQFTGSYFAPPFNAWFWTGWYDELLAREIGLSIANSEYICLGRGDIFAHKEIYKGSRDLVFAHLDDAGFFKMLRERLDIEAAQTLALIRDSVSSSEPAQALFEVAKLFRRVTFFWAVGYFCAMSMDGLLNENAKKAGIAPGDIPDFIGDIETSVVRRQRQLQDFAERRKKGMLQDEHLDAHIREYGWVGMIGFTGDRLTRDALVAELDSVRKPARVARKHHNADFEKYASIARDLFYCNQMGAEYFQICGAESIELLEKTASALHISRADIGFLMPPELIPEASQTDLGSKIDRRRSFVLAYRKNVAGEIQIIDEPDEAQRLIDLFQRSQKGPTSYDVQGYCGNRGAARGRVRIVHNTQDIGTFESGDILVTSMTTPDFVPLMQKASAIVTDMGGLLSHAVIMSRELGKPCIIGTKNGTEVFKDGDMVEVDADSGIVRKI